MSRQLSLAKKPVPGLVLSTRLRSDASRKKSKVSDLEEVKVARNKPIFSSDSEDSFVQGEKIFRKSGKNQAHLSLKPASGPKSNPRLLFNREDDNSTLSGNSNCKKKSNIKPPVDYIEAYTRGSTDSDSCERCPVTSIKQYGTHGDSLDSDDSDKTLELYDKEYLKRRHIHIHLNDDCLYSGSRARLDYRGIVHWIIQKDSVTPTQSEPSHWNHLVPPHHRQPHDKPPICLKTGKEICILCMHHRERPLIVNCLYCGVKVHKDCNEKWFEDHHQDLPSVIPRQCCPFCREFIPFAKHRSEERKQKGYIQSKIKEATAWWARRDNYIHKQLILFSSYFYNNHHDQILVPLNYKEEYYNIRTYKRVHKK